MDAKDLRTESTQRSNDSSSKFTHSVSALPCNTTKAYDNMSSNPLAKVETPTSRPCAVIGPDRIVPPPPAGDAYLKKGHYEPWPPMDNTYRPPPEYPHKMPSYLSPLGNISPRQTFQENMPRIMVQPTYNSKVKDDASFALDRNLSKTGKISAPADLKYCDVPYSVTPINNDQKNTEMCVPSVNNARNYPQMWHPAGVNMRPTRPYGAPELYQYPEYASCAGPRPAPMSRPHRTINEDPGHVYSDPYYHESNVRYKPYPNVKERYPQSRYEYVSNYTNPFHPPHAFPPYKYDMQKPLPPHPTHSQVPIKYVDNRMADPVLDGYHRAPQGPYATPYRNQMIHPSYGPMIGNNLPNKIYSYPPESPVKPVVSNKLPYDNKLYVDYDTARNKGFPMTETFYDMRQHMKNQVIIPNFPAANMQPIHPHLYYRKENLVSKNEYMTHLRHLDPSLNPNSLTKLSSQFSPSSIAISPSDSNTSNDTAHTQGGSLEDCGYVSQSSNASIRSVDSGVNRAMHNDFHRRYNYAYPSAVRTSPVTSKPDIGNVNNTKNKKGINVRQFLQMWNEGDEENGGNPKEVLPQQEYNTNKQSQYEVAKNHEQLYVLGLMDVPSEELGKYEHIQKVSKLPENIKGYNNVELLKHFEEAIESSNLNHLNQKQSIQRNYHTAAKNPLLQALPPRPLSPLDVEAKISQSVIHKEVGCNFEIKPCSPEMLNVQVATPATNILNERTIEKVTNPLVIKPPLLSNNSNGNENTCNVMKQNDHTLILNENDKIPSCKMINTQCLNSDGANVVKANYSLQDLESNAGVCFASLPRLDNDIELHFPEVNQQFINANKESVITTIDSHTKPNNDHFKKDETAENLESAAKGGESEKEFCKLSKYRKIKRNDGEKPLKMNSQSLRTDSVIIKNPENIKSFEYSLGDNQSYDKKKEEEDINFDLAVDSGLESNYKDKHEDLPNEIALDFSLNKIDTCKSKASSQKEISKNVTPENEITEDSTTHNAEIDTNSDKIDTSAMQNNASPIITDVISADEYSIIQNNVTPISTSHISENVVEEKLNSTILSNILPRISTAEECPIDEKSMTLITEDSINNNINNTTSDSLRLINIQDEDPIEDNNIAHVIVNKENDALLSSVSTNNVSGEYLMKENNETELSTPCNIEKGLNEIKNNDVSSLNTLSAESLQNDCKINNNADNNGNAENTNSCTYNEEVSKPRTEMDSQKVTLSKDNNINYPSILTEPQVKEDANCQILKIDNTLEENDTQINVKISSQDDNDSEDNINTNSNLCQDEHLVESFKVRENAASPSIDTIAPKNDNCSLITRDKEVTTLKSLDACDDDSRSSMNTEEISLNVDNIAKNNSDRSERYETCNDTTDDGLTPIETESTLSMGIDHISLETNDGFKGTTNLPSLHNDINGYFKSQDEYVQQQQDNNKQHDKDHIECDDTSVDTSHEENKYAEENIDINYHLHNKIKNEIERSTGAHKDVIQTECAKIVSTNNNLLDQVIIDHNQDIVQLNTINDYVSESKMNENSTLNASVCDESTVISNNITESPNRGITLKKELFSPWIQKLILSNEGKCANDNTISESQLDTLTINASSDLYIPHNSNMPESELKTINTENKSEDKLDNRFKENINVFSPKVFLQQCDENAYVDVISSDCKDISTNDIFGDSHPNFDEEVIELASHDITITADSGIYEIADNTDLVEENADSLSLQVPNNIDNDEDSIEKSLNQLHNDNSIQKEDLYTKVNTPVKRSLKRSLSDSALSVYKDDIHDQEEHPQKDYTFRSKKFKKNNNAFLNVFSIQNNRRNSISSVYNEENMSFCIVIGNNCIISEENDEEEKICYDISDQCFTTIHSNSVNEDGMEPSSEIILCPQDDTCQYVEPLILEVSDDKNYEESWVDDVACEETVVSDDIGDDIVLSAPSSPRDIDESDNGDSIIFNEHTEKVTYICGDEMCNRDEELVETLYHTPQTDVIEDCHVSDDYDDYEKDIIEDVISESHESLFNTPKADDMSDANISNNNSYDIQNNSTINETPSPSSNTEPQPIKTYSNCSNTSIEKTEVVNINSCETSIDDALCSLHKEDSSSHTAFSSPEVSSTTPEEKNSTILLKITNYKGTRISQLTEGSLNRINTNSCRFTENVNYASYQSNSTNPRPLMTKAAQKYIPPPRDTVVDDLKVKLPLPRHSLMKYKELKNSRNERCNANLKKEVQKKHKPKFEDVLKSIDEIQFKMHKEKSKKPKKSVPKVVIKKNENGSHYASTPTKDFFNPDLTGRKWQPWVFIEKNIFIDKMAARKKTKAVFNHRKNTYVFADKFKKYKSIPSANFVITQPKVDDSSTGQFKYTIRLKHSY